MNNAVNHLVTVSAHQRASKTYREERSRRKPCNPHEAKEKHQGSRQEQTTKDAVTDKRLLQKSVPKETVHNTKPVATKYHEQRKEKLDKTRKPRIKIERKRARNRPLLCQMPCSDRGIRREKESHAQHRHRLQNRDQNGIKVEEPALGGGWVEDIESRKMRQGSMDCLQECPSCLRCQAALDPVSATARLRSKSGLTAAQ